MTILLIMMSNKIFISHIPLINSFYKIFPDYKKDFLIFCMLFKIVVYVLRIFGNAVIQKRIGELPTIFLRDLVRQWLRFSNRNCDHCYKREYSPATRVKAAV